MARDDDYDRPSEPGEARRKASVPAIFLILTGGFGLLIEMASVVTAVTSPNVVADFYQKAVIDPLPAEQRADVQQQFDQQKDQMRLNSPLNFISYVAAIVMHLLTILGGIKMKGLSGYPLALTGAITAIIPISGCCCLTTPVGIWAVVVLANPAVRAAFGAGQRPPVDDFDDLDR